MANAFSNGTPIASAMIGGLLDTGVLINAAWRDADASFVAGKGDTVRVRRLATQAATDFTGTTALTDATEVNVDVPLNFQPYVQSVVSTKEKNLRVEDFYKQVIAPGVGGVAEFIENRLAVTLAGTTTAGVRGTTGKKAILKAFEYLGDAKVPQTDRILACSPTFASVLLDEDFMSSEKMANGGLAYREAIIGRTFGFTVLVSSFIADVDSGDTGAAVDPTAYAFHRTGLVMASRTPAPPEGGAMSAVAAFDGVASRVVSAWDNSKLSDVITVDTLFGCVRGHDARIVPVAIAAD